MTFLNFWVLSVFAAYFVILIGIAVLRARQMREMQDYVLGSRRLSAATSALSASSSAVSSGSMLVVPALAFVDGGATLWLAGSVFVGAVFSWTVLARRLRRYTFAAGNSLTISEFLEKRFDDRTGVLRSLVAVVTLFFVIIYISSGLVGGSKLLQEIFGLAPNAGIVVTLMAVASYTLVGGFLAVSRTDVFQSLLMLASFTIIPVMLLQMTDNLVTGMPAGGLEFLNPFNDAQGNALSWVYLASLPGWGLAACGSLVGCSGYSASRTSATAQYGSSTRIRLISLPGACCATSNSRGTSTAAAKVVASALARLLSVTNTMSRSVASPISATPSTIRSGSPSKLPSTRSASAVSRNPAMDLERRANRELER